MSKRRDAHVETPQPPIALAVPQANDAFDPDAPAGADSGIFGLSTRPEAAGVHILGVPFDATTSYRQGTAAGPGAIFEASRQVDLFDPQQATWGNGCGRPWKSGLYYVEDSQVSGWNAEAARLSAPIIERGGQIAGDAELEAALERVNAIGGLVNQNVRDWTAARLDSHCLPVLVGGDHSIPFGGIQAAAEACGPLGILHFDAHADLRPAYEGFRWSHASIMWNVLQEIPQVIRLVSVGLRDIGEGESRTISNSEGRIQGTFAHEWARARARGMDLEQLAAERIAGLPENVWLSIDIDGLDPSWCPNTGTPVPGGLTWDELLLWLGCLADSGKRVVGLDLCEVNPGPSVEGEDGWDAIVGARLLYKAIGAALGSREIKGLKSQ